MSSPGPPYEGDFRKEAGYDATCNNFLHGRHVIIMTREMQVKCGKTVIKSFKRGIRRAYEEATLRTGCWVSWTCADQP
jgi:hypothetical protein